jgi:cytochrome c
MDSFEINKLIGGFLATCFVVFSLSLVSDAIFAALCLKAGLRDRGGRRSGRRRRQARRLKNQSFRCSPAPVSKTARRRRRSAPPAIRSRRARQQTGPNLYGVVGRPIASHDFAYSAAIKEFSQGSSLHWDYEHLDKFLTSPKGLGKARRWASPVSRRRRTAPT